MGMKVFAYTADLAQPDESDPKTIPPVAREHGAVEARLIDCREAMAREGVVAIQCGAFHLSSGGKKILQHDAARSRRDHDGHHPRHARGRRARVR